MEDEQNSAAPRTLAELLERIEEGWNTLQRAIDEMGSERLTSLRDNAGWNAKDHLAHITTWEQYLMAMIQKQPVEPILGLDEPEHQHLDEDGINAVIQRRNAGRTLGNVLEGLRATHVDLLAELEKFSDADLFKPYSHYQPDDRPYNPDPIIGWIIGNTYEHYEAHAGWMRTLAGVPSGPAA